MAPNLQTIGNGADATNRATLGNDAAADNTAHLPHDANANNTQAIPTLSASSNHQSVDEAGMAGTNRQALAPSADLPPNHQPIDTPASELNRQAAPEDLPPPTNRQAVDGEHLADHFEALPSTAVQRAKVDFPTSPDPQSAPKKPAVGTNRNVKIRSAPTPSRQGNAPARTAEQLTEHEKFIEAFHGRLAGIKHEVDQINDRLDVFEHKK
jgi:hypothetical protein